MISNGLKHTPPCWPLTSSTGTITRGWNLPHSGFGQESAGERPRREAGEETSATPELHPLQDIGSILPPKCPFSRDTQHWDLKTCEILSFQILAIDSNRKHIPHPPHPPHPQVCLRKQHRKGHLWAGRLRPELMQDPPSGAFLLGRWPDIYLPSWSQSSSANLSCVGGVCFSGSLTSQATSRSITYPASLAAGVVSTGAGFSSGEFRCRPRFGSRGCPSGGKGPQEAGEGAHRHGTSHVGHPSKPDLSVLPEVPELQNILNKSLF